MGALWGELGEKSTLLGTMIVRSFQYLTTGSETDIGPQRDSTEQTTHDLGGNLSQQQIISF
jgi:hypothetical protein